MQVDAKLYVWGGEGSEKRSFDVPARGTDSDDSDSDDDSDEEQMEPVWMVTTLPPPRLTNHPFDVYDMQTCTWSRQKTSGDAPLLGLGSCVEFPVHANAMQHNTALVSLACLEYISRCTKPVFLIGSSLNYHPETCTIYLFGGWKEGLFDADVYRVRVDPEVDEWHWERVEIKPGAIKPSGRCT